MPSGTATRAVLVVEDEPLLRLDIAEGFEAAGFKTFEAGSAAEAIEILQREPEIRVVFTDIDMPGTMDGLELAHLIRERWPPTILIVSSGRQYPAPDALPPAARFIPKPYWGNTLAEVVQMADQEIAHA
jgi:CheY-like chemotaxis protein